MRRLRQLRDYRWISHPRALLRTRSLARPDCRASALRCSSAANSRAAAAAARSDRFLGAQAPPLHEGLHTSRGCRRAEAADEQSWQWASRGSLTAGVRWCTNTAVFARAWIVASRAWIVNRPCARLNLTEAASGLAIRSSRIVHVLELVPGGTRSEKLSRMCTFPVPSRPSCTYFPFRFECSYSMKVHRRDAHGAVREVRDGERVWWNGHTNEWVYGCSAPSRSIDRCCTVR